MKRPKPEQDEQRVQDMLVGLRIYGIRHQRAGSRIVCPMPDGSTVRIGPYYAIHVTTDDEWSGLVAYGTHLLEDLSELRQALADEVRARREVMK